MRKRPGEAGEASPDVPSREFVGISGGKVTILILCLVLSPFFFLPLILLVAVWEPTRADLAVVSLIVLGVGLACIALVHWHRRRSRSNA